MSATEASRSFAALLDDAQHGETILLTRSGRRIVVIGPVSAGNGADGVGLLHAVLPDEDFAAGVRAAHDAVPFSGARLARRLILAALRLTPQTVGGQQTPIGCCCRRRDHQIRTSSLPRRRDAAQPCPNGMTVLGELDAGGHHGCRTAHPRSRLTARQATGGCWPMYTGHRRPPRTGAPESGGLQARAFPLTHRAR